VTGPKAGQRPGGRLLLTAVLATVLVACGSDDDDGPPLRTLDTAAAPGFAVASDVNTGFAVSLPESWRKLPTDLASFDTAAEEIRSQSDMVEAPLTQLKSVVRNGASMAAIDPATGSTANLIVLAADSDLDDLALNAAIRLRETGATDLTREAITVDGIPGVRQRFRVPFPAENGNVILQESQTYVIRREKAFILTLVGDSPDLERVANSLRLA
jgi:hypothetical protein